MESRTVAANWPRWEPLTGVLAVALWLLGAFIFDGAADTPDSDASPEEVLAFYQEDADKILFGGSLFMIGAAAMIWFLGSLRVRLLAYEGEPARHTSIAFAGGLATAIFLMGIPGADMAAAIEEDDLSPTSADALHDLGDLFFVGAEVSAVVLTLATALVVLRTGALPRLVGWLSILLAVWLVIPPIGWAGLLLGFPLWLIAISILLTLPPRSREASEPLAPAGG